MREQDEKIVGYTIPSEDLRLIAIEGFFKIYNKCEESYGSSAEMRQLIDKHISDLYKGSNDAEITSRVVYANNYPVQISITVDADPKKDISVRSISEALYKQLNEARRAAMQ